MNENKLLLIRKQSTREDETREICTKTKNQSSKPAVTITAATTTTVHDDCTDGCRLSTKKRRCSFVSNNGSSKNLQEILLQLHICKKHFLGCSSSVGPLQN
ncbi:hypothetical protein T4B_13195 [Trichinella pseudospiralis]|uniref:Uncharacterized protein n=1 Tax=Trichinella pseudospiralis TaxID=6337 RepID=A0A0V1J362_TRIPS|nr:hypothetical protein T4B_13195 [Trichinella pseudospiralis]